MEIVKHGKHEESKKVEVFRCSACGCIFKADKSEYKIEVDENLIVHYCKYPSEI